MSFIFAIITLFLFFTLVSLRKRIISLEKKNKAIVRKLYALEEEKVATQDITNQQSNVVSGVDNVFSKAADAADTLIAKEEEEGSLATWLQENWMLKVGVLLILIGFGWFISYAFINNWIGPFGRVAIGLFTGAALCLFGAWRMVKDASQGMILLIIGSAIVQITLFASRNVYDFFSPFSVLTISFLVALYLAVISMKYNSERLALYGIGISLAAPLFVYADSPFFIETFVYVLLVSVGTIWLSIKKGWDGTNALSLVGLFLYLVSYFSEGTISTSVGEVLNPETVAVFLLVSLSSFLFFVVNVATVVSRKVFSKSAIMFIAIGNSIVILLCTLGLVSGPYQSLVLGLWVIVFGIGGYFVAQKKQTHTFFYIYSLIAALFLAIAFAIELDGPVLALALIIESVCVVVMTYFVTRQTEVLARISIVMIVPFVVALPSVFASAWSNRVPGSDLVVATLASAALIFVGVYILSKYNKNEDDTSVRSSYVTSIISGIAILFVLFWQLTHVLFSDDIGTILSLSVYTVLGIVAYIHGHKEENTVIKYFGSTVLMLVILRLILVDVWAMELAVRIVTFILVGVLLVSTAFFGKRKKTPIASIALLLILSSFVFPNTVLANEENVAQVRASFQDVGQIMYDSSFTIPTVIDVPVHDTSAERSDSFALYSTTKKVLVPYIVIEQKTGEDTIPILQSTAIPNMELSHLVDGDNQSAVDFLLQEGGERNSATINYLFPTPITSSELVMKLDAYVIRPNEITVGAIVDGRKVTVLANYRPEYDVVTFPSFTARQWFVEMTYSQPLRFTELNFEDSTQKNKTRTVRFLAQPEDTYELYFSPEVRVSQILSEQPQLSSVAPQDITTALLSASVINPLFAPADSDNDGVSDFKDNCVSVKNEDQLDTNKNGRGDMCEDFDKDGVLNNVDNCPDTPNRYQKDVDTDGVGDLCDEEESRFTERNSWIVWAGLAAAGVVFITLLLLSLRKKEDGDSDGIVENN
jgi:hypothetical protein